MLIQLTRQKHSTQACTYQRKQVYSFGRRDRVLRKASSDGEQKSKKDDNIDQLDLLDSLLGQEQKKPEPPPKETQNSEEPTPEPKVATSGADPSTASREYTEAQLRTYNSLADEEEELKRQQVQEPVSQQNRNVVFKDIPFVPREDVELLKTVVLGYTFYVTEVDDMQEKDGVPGVTFNGNLRKPAGEAQKEIQERLEQRFGDAYVLYMLGNPNAPYVAVVPKEFAARTTLFSTTTQYVAAIVLGTASILSTLYVNGFPLGLLFAEDASINLPSVLQAVAPGTLGFLAIIASHEIGHITAAKKNNVELTPPLVVPALSGILCSLGTITNFKKPAKNRQVLFEVTAAGPIYGLVVSILVYLAGLLLTQAGVGCVVNLPSLTFADSAFVGFTAKFLIGNVLQGTAAVSINPLALAGMSGVLVNGLSMLPLGTTDGGKVAMTVLGRDQARVVGSLAFLGLSVLGIFINPVYLVYSIYVAFFQRGPNQPMSNELDGLPREKSASAFAVLLVPLVLLAPIPPQSLGILTPADIDIQKIQEYLNKEIARDQDLRQQEQQQQGLLQQGQVQAPNVGFDGDVSV